MGSAGIQYLLNLPGDIIAFLFFMINTLLNMFVYLFMYPFVLIGSIIGDFTLTSTAILNMLSGIFGAFLYSDWLIIIYLQIALALLLSAAGLIKKIPFL
jgi:hypothetical protein